MVRVLTGIALLATAGLAPSQATTLRQAAYVWQRAWTAPVTNAVATLAPRFDALIALQAEVSWNQGAPQCTRVNLDYTALQSAGKPVGLALRIGSFHGPFNPGDPRTTYLATLAGTLVAEAEAHHLRPAELQLDFDCAEANLQGYRVWLRAIQQAVGPVPVRFTALPSWLKHPDFKRLAESAPGYVLQVHSFERPRGPDAPITLCDPSKATQAVQQASSLGVPFRVALPTYGYLAAFTPAGAFLGLSAEGPAPHWPPTTRIIEVRSDPVALSELVRHWSQNRMPHLEGLVWYRLPVPEDRLNWRWPTLQAVLAGTAPAADLRADLRRPQPGLVEIDLVNQGTADASPLPALTVEWSSQRAIAMDGLQGCTPVRTGPARLRFEASETGTRLNAGERMRVGWIRFDGDPELEMELDALPN